MLQKYILLLCTVLTLLAACSSGGSGREITPDELDPALNQEIDPSKEVRRFEDFFNSIGKIDLMGDGTLVRLVRETCGPYFAGDKTLDETVALVQNRIGLYISEQK